MTFFNESWFWAGAFTFLASIGAVWVKGWLAGRSQLKLERQRMYEKELLEAHKRLYRFLTETQDTLYPPDEHQRVRFFGIMRDTNFKALKADVLLFTDDIRKGLAEFEAQCDCAGDPDLIPSIPFEEFLEKHASRKLQDLREIVERRTDEILHK